MLPSCPFSTCVTPEIWRRTHPEGEPCRYICFVVFFFFLHFCTLTCFLQFPFDIFTYSTLRQRVRPSYITEDRLRQESPGMLRFWTASQGFLLWLLLLCVCCYCCCCCCCRCCCLHMATTVLHRRSNTENMQQTYRDMGKRRWQNTHGTNWYIYITPLPPRARPAHGF